MLYRGNLKVDMIYLQTSLKVKKREERREGMT